jgi:hypothetical protein
MNPGQSIAFISDVGAFELKPLFISASVITTILVDISLLSERFLRHRGRRLVSNYTVTEKRLSVAGIVCAVVGGMGLALLTVFDTNNYATVHNVFLFVFMGGYIASAVCSCWEYQSLGTRESTSNKKIFLCMLLIHISAPTDERQYCILRASFWIKLVFIIVQIALAIAFVVTLSISAYNAAAVLEWALAFVFGVFSE